MPQAAGNPIMLTIKINHSKAIHGTSQQTTYVCFARVLRVLSEAESDYNGLIKLMGEFQDGTAFILQLECRFAAFNQVYTEN